MSRGITRTTGLIPLPTNPFGAGEASETKTHYDKGENEPPFDGHPCPACPTVVRSLHTGVRSLLAALDTDNADNIAFYLKVVRKQSDEMQAYMERHFADDRHAHNRKRFAGAYINQFTGSYVGMSGMPPDWPQTPKRVRYEQGMMPW